MREKAFIYFFTDGLVIKIGRSTQWRKRMDRISKKIDCGLWPRLILVRESHLEQQLHAMFSDCRISMDYDGPRTKEKFGREWFHPKPGHICGDENDGSGPIEAYIEKHLAEDVTDYWNKDIARNGWDDADFQRWKIKSRDEFLNHPRRKEIEAFMAETPTHSYWRYSTDAILRIMDSIKEHRAKKAAA